MPFDFNATKQILAGLDERLRPIANRIVDVTEPDWANKLRQTPNPLDQAGIRLEAEAILGSLLQAYRTEGPAVRASVRKLLASNPSVAWAANVRQSPTTEEGFRLKLLFLSAVDQAADLRDTITTLHDIYAKAKAAGIATSPILKEVAALSSDESRDTMGSLRSILLNARWQVRRASCARTSMDVDPEPPLACDRFRATKISNFPKNEHWGRCTIEESIPREPMMSVP